MPKRHEKKRVPRKEKRCIPKEGMPHVHKTSRKKRREEKNIAHVQEKKYIYTRREIDHAKEFIHYPPKIFHTLACLD